MSERHQKRLVIDYLQTLKKFAHQDAYSRFRIDDTVNKIASIEILAESI